MRAYSERAVFLDQAKTGCKQKVVILGLLEEFARNREDADDVLVLSKTFKQIANVGTSRLATSERCFPGLQAVGAPLVGEDKEAIFAEASRDELGRVFAFVVTPFRPRPPRFWVRKVSTGVCRM